MVVVAELGRRRADEWCSDNGLSLDYAPFGAPLGMTEGGRLDVWGLATAG